MFSNWRTFILGEEEAARRDEAQEKQRFEEIKRRALTEQKNGEESKKDSKERADDWSVLITAVVLTFLIDVQAVIYFFTSLREEVMGMLIGLRDWMRGRQQRAAPRPTTAAPTTAGAGAGAQPQSATAPVFPGLGYIRWDLLIGIADFLMNILQHTRILRRD